MILPEQVPLRASTRYPKSVGGALLSATVRQIEYLRRTGREPATIRMDVDKIAALQSAYGWPRTNWTLFGCPVVPVAPQVCLDVVPVGAVDGIDWIDRLYLDSLLDDAR